MNERMKRHKERLKVLDKMLISKWEPKKVWRNCLSCNTRVELEEQNFVCSTCKNGQEWKSGNL